MSSEEPEDQPVTFTDITEDSEAPALSDSVAGQLHFEQVDFAYNPSQEFTIRITEAVKVEPDSKLTRGYMKYTIETRTQLDHFHSPEARVDRRYSDFFWFRSQLVAKYPSVLVPPLPEKDILTKWNKFTPEHIQYRRRELERFLNRTAAHPKLAHTAELRVFLEGNDEWTQARASGTQYNEDGEEIENKGKMAQFTSFFSKKVADVQAAGLSGLTGSYTEIDPFFDQQKEYLTGLEAELKQLANNAATLVKRRKDMQNVFGEFKDAAVELATTEQDHDQWLSAAYTKVGEIYTQLEQLNQELGESETVGFEQSLRDYQRLVGAAKDMLVQRGHALNAYQTNSAAAEKGKPNKLEETKARYESLTAACKEELSRFNAQKVGPVAADSSQATELRETLTVLVQININHELRVVDLWKDMQELAQLEMQ